MGLGGRRGYPPALLPDGAVEAGEGVGDVGFLVEKLT